MAQIIWATKADEDMKMINDYISIDSEFHAAKVIDKICERVTVLETHIRVGKVVREFNDPLIRELLEGFYRIIYRIESEDMVSILRVYHGARLLKKL